MIPGHLAMVRLLHRGFGQIVASKPLFDSYFRNDEGTGGSEFWGTDAERARWHADLVANFVPRADGTFKNIERGFPRSNSKWPAIYCPIASEQDSQHFIGLCAQYDPQDQTEHIGSVEDVTVSVDIYAENLNELDVLHHIIKGLVRSNLEWLVTNTGIDNILYKFGGDIQPGQWLPETVFVRAQRYELRGLATQVLNLAAPVNNVYTHLDAATFDDGGTPTKGKITPTGTGG